jgi:hypothetical protein
MTTPFDAGQMSCWNFHRIGCVDPTHAYDLATADTKVATILDDDNSNAS